MSDERPGGCTRAGMDGDAIYLTTIRMAEAAAKTLRIVIPGEPVAWQRVRRGRNGAYYVPRATKNAERGIAWSWRSIHGSRLLEGDLAVEARFYYCGRNKDLDNMVKILDGLNRVAWKDDRQIVALTAYKEWSQNPRTEITVWEMGR